MITLTIILAIVILIAARILIHFARTDWIQGRITATEKMKLECACYGAIATACVFACTAIIMKILGA